VVVLLPLLMILSTIVQSHSEHACNIELAGNSSMVDDSAWMPFKSVLERQSCLNIPAKVVAAGTSVAQLHFTAFLSLDRSFMTNFVTNNLLNVSSQSPESLVEDLIHAQKMVRVRREEVQQFWENPGPALWLDCMYIRDRCTWEVSLARLNNSGITLFEYLFVNYNEPQSHLDSPGTLCLAASKTVVNADIFRQRRPRVIVIDESQVADLDIRVLAHGLSSMGKLVILGRLTSTAQSIFEAVGFHVFEHDNFFVAVLKPQAMESDSINASQNSIGKIANVYVANMEDDYSARYPAACENFRTAGLGDLWPKHERFRAINGRKELAITFELRNIFRVNEFSPRNPYTDHGFRRGTLGCAVTHLLLWTKLAKRTDLSDLDSIIILEDDFYFVQDVADLWRQGPGHSLSMSDPRWDVMMLGYYNDVRFIPGIPVWDGVEAFPTTSRSFGLGAHGYILRKRGAKRLLNFIHTFGMAQANDHIVMEAWVQNHIVAYKSIPWLVYSKSQSPGYPSTTYEDYVYSKTAHCPRNAQGGTFKLQNQKETSLSDGPKKMNLALNPANLPDSHTIQNPILHPDLLLDIGLDFSPDVSVEDFHAKHPCAQFCLQYGHNNFSYPPPQCYFLFDNHVQSVYSDPKRMQIGQETKIFVALLTADGQIWENSISEPLVVNASATVAHMELYEVQPDQLELEVVISHAPANFMTIHSSSLLCVNEHCDPLASFPVDFNVSVSSNEGLAVNATLQTLGSERDLAIPIEHFYRTSSGEIDFVNVRAVLRGL